MTRYSDVNKIRQLYNYALSTDTPNYLHLYFTFKEFAHIDDIQLKNSSSELFEN